MNALALNHKIKIYVVANLRFKYALGLLSRIIVGF